MSSSSLSSRKAGRVRWRSYCKHLFRWWKAVCTDSASISWASWLNGWISWSCLKKWRISEELAIQNARAAGLSRCDWMRQETLCINHNREGYFANLYMYYFKSMAVSLSIHNYIEWTWLDLLMSAFKKWTQVNTVSWNVNVVIGLFSWDLISRQLTWMAWCVRLAILITRLVILTALSWGLRSGLYPLESENRTARYMV